MTTFIRIMSALLDVNLLREDVEKKGVIYCVQMFRVFKAN